MRANITTELVRKLPHADLDIYDTKLRGLVLRCRRSGFGSYRVSLGRGRWFTIGRADRLTPTEAREKAHEALGQRSKGLDPKAAALARVTFKRFVSEHYEPWATVQRKTGAEQTARLRATFGPALNNLQIGSISAFQVERWRSARLKAGLKPSTINRDLNVLRAALNLAKQWRLITTHPLADVKPSKVDRSAAVRFLSTDEERRLRAALVTRDDTRRAERANANHWRHERGYAARPPLGDYTDHLTPLVILALNTGLRRGELFALRWQDVDLDRALLTVHGVGAKSLQTRHLPLNLEAATALATWKAQRSKPRPSAVVFAGPDGAALTDIKTAWSALIDDARLQEFRFHDCRHHFASRLVQAGVDLNTVRELLGHADLKMTLRYAHLAPENKATAVAKLVAR